MDKDMWLQKYLQGSLTAEQQEEFQQRLASDPELAAETAFALELQEALAQKEYEKAKSELAVIHQKSKRTKIWQWAIAASLTILLVVSSFGWFEANEAATSDLLFATYFEPYRNVVAPEVRGDQNESDIANAFAAYDTEDFETALYHFERLEQPSPITRLYQANSLMMLDRAQDALMLLETDRNVEDTFTRERWWFLSLSYLKLDQRETTADALKQMLKTEGSFKQAEAEALVTLLEGSFAPEDHKATK